MNKFTFQEENDFELGLNCLIGNVSAETEEQSALYGVDLTYTMKIDSNRNLRLQSEIYHAQYSLDGTEREEQSGGFVAAMLDLNPSYRTGIRFGKLGRYGNEGDEFEKWSLMLIRQLTKTSQMRFQYNTGENIENAFLINFVFGMGSYAKVLE